MYIISANGEHFPKWCGEKCVGSNFTNSPHVTLQRSSSLLLLCMDTSLHKVFALAFYLRRRGGVDEKFDELENTPS